MNPAVVEWVEKYLKAALQANNIHIPKIHYLLELLALILKFDTSYEFLRIDLDTLEDYGYPGEFAEKDQAQSAYQAAKVIREFIQQKLGVN